MAKRARKKAQVRTGNKKWVLALATTVIVAAIGGWWLFDREKNSEIRKIFLEQVSIIVDRVDELANAWNSRGSSNSKTSGNESGQSGKAKQRAVKTVAVKKAEKRTPPAAPEVLAPEDEITAEDQEKLNELMKKLNER